MALSNAERQKRYRERRQAKNARPATPRPMPVKRTFAEFINADETRFQAFDTAMDWLNSGRLLPWEKWVDANNAVDTCMDFIGTLHSDGVIAGAFTIAGLVNEYKVEQIDAQLLELEHADLSTPALKEAADKFAEHLRHIRKQLQRKNRYEFPPMWVDGE